MNRKSTTLEGLALLVAAAISVGCGDQHEDDAPMPMPPPPTDLRVEPLTGGAHLTWKDNSDNESAFMVERADIAAEFKTVSTVPFDTVQYHDGSVTPGATYKYRVMAMPKQEGHSELTEYSNEVTFVAPEAEMMPDPLPAGGMHSGH